MIQTPVQWIRMFVLCADVCKARTLKWVSVYSLMFHSTYNTSFRGRVFSGNRLCYKEENYAWQNAFWSINLNEVNENATCWKKRHNRSRSCHLFNCGTVRRSRSPRLGWYCLVPPGRHWCNSFSCRTASRTGTSGLLTTTHTDVYIWNHSVNTRMHSQSSTFAKEYVLDHYVKLVYNT